MPADAPVPLEITLDRERRVLTVHYEDGATFPMSSEYLRVHSPSADVAGHHGGEPKLVTGKQDVTIEAIEPVGNYAVRLVFSDRHATGLFTWKVLYALGRDRDQNWQRYLERCGRGANPDLTGPRS